MCAKSASVKDVDINIDIADTLGYKYRYRIDISKGDTDPPLALTSCLQSLSVVLT